MRTAFSYAMAFCASLIVFSSPRACADVLLEAESFTNHGGWKLDTQFIDEMGSPYLLAHGLGRPVDDASTEIEFAEGGTYHVFVRTKDWVRRWDADGSPGRFRLQVNEQVLAPEFGTESADWDWQSGGSIEIPAGTATIRLQDLTGFDGRCDCILFSKSSTPPPGSDQTLPGWRRELLNLPEAPITEGPYDLVVVGGGYAGMGAALSAARMGCRVALIQNRPVLGGNGSSEVRVWAMGNIRRGKYPRVGEIIEEFADKATKSPGRAEEFGDSLKEQIIRAEDNIDLFLNHHAFAADTEDSRILSVSAFDTRTSAIRRFEGRLFCDCTGHGTIGALAEADWDMTPEDRMGMSNMWRWDEAEGPTEFPETPWALDLTMKDFPYPRDHHGQWFWESGFSKDPLQGAEAIRDWNLRAVYGAFNAMKNRDGAEGHRNAILTWVAYIGGPRESRRLMGDVVLTQDDVVAKREFPDGCVPSTWSIDLHYPREQYAAKFPDNPFISKAVHDRRIDRQYGYPVPYRCFYSRNIDNLFMAGRNISVTHQALGTTRVMKTCGMMGEVVGRAASLCILHECNPREIYDRYLTELLGLLEFPGKARRATVYDPVEIPEDAMKLAGPMGPAPGLDPEKMEGIVIDDLAADKTGTWGSGTGLKGFVAYGYLYASDPTATISFPFEVPSSGDYEVRIAYLSHENRGTRVPVTIRAGGEESLLLVDMTKPAPLDGKFFSLGRYKFRAGQTHHVLIAAKNAGGNAHADAVQIIPIDP